MGIREREAQIGKRAVIGRRRHQQIRILPVSSEIARTGIGTAMSGALRLRHSFAGLRARRCCCRQELLRRPSPPALHVA